MLLIITMWYVLGILFPSPESYVVIIVGLKKKICVIFIYVTSEGFEVWKPVKWQFDHVGRLNAEIW